MREPVAAHAEDVEVLVKRLRERAVLYDRFSFATQDASIMREAASATAGLLAERDYWKLRAEEAQDSANRARAYLLRLAIAEDGR